MYGHPAYSFTQISAKLWGEGLDVQPAQDVQVQGLEQVEHLAQDDFKCSSILGGYRGITSLL